MSTISENTNMASLTGKLRIAVAQMAVGKDKIANVAKARSYIKQASEKNAQVVILPECFNSPYGTQYFHEYGENQSDSWTLAQLKEQIKETPMTVIAGSIPEKVEGRCYNTSFTLNPEGEIIAKHRKTHLFDIDIPGKITFKESETLTPGDSATTFDYKEHAGVKFGVGICYDIRFPEQALCMRYTHGANVLVYPGAFNMTTGPAHWAALARGRALDTQSFCIVASPARVESKTDYVAYGHSTIFGPWGDVVAKLEDGEGLLVADIDMTKVSEIRGNIPISMQRKPEMFQ